MFEALVFSDREGSELSVGANSFVGGSKFVVAQRIEIGDDVLISWGCTIVDHDSHSLIWPERAQDVSNHYQGRKDWANVKIAPVRIANRVWIGFDCIILKGVTIGEGAVVAAGSVVTKSVAPYTLVAGNPARPIRSLERLDS